MKEISSNLSTTKKSANSHNHSHLTMVWKKRRSHGPKSSSGQTPRGPVRLKSCLKKDYDNSVSSQGSSSRVNEGGAGSQGNHSSKSGDSRYSGSSSAGKCLEGSCEQRSHASSCSGNTGSSNADSRHSSSQQSAKVSPIEKVVRFSEIQIRDYERVVGDNPSCSTGPPIAIGWAHGAPRIMDVDNYEAQRRYRGKNAPLVLPREDRETILLDWGVSFHDIIDAIRTNIKVKNKRRQTVTNLGKIERLEEVFESATRKLKRALLLKRRTGDKVKELQEQAVLARNALASLKIAEEHVLSEMRAEEAPLQIEPDADNLENLQLQVSVSTLCRNPPAESKLVRAQSTISEDDQMSAISGFTLGNSTTASVLEMEKFYRELELEMFGDVPLPSMVGQTLELPGASIPEEERVYYDPPSVTNFAEPPSVYPDDDLNECESKEFYERSPPQRSTLLYNHPEMNVFIRPSPVMLPVRVESKTEFSTRYGRSMLSQALAQSHEMAYLQRGSPVHATHTPQNTSYTSVSPCYNGFDDFSHLSYQASNARLSNSLDSADLIGSRMHRMMWQAEHASLPPPHLYAPNRYGNSPNSAFEFQNGFSHEVLERGDRRYVQKTQQDGPDIRHLPPPTHLSPTHWMEGDDGPRIHPMYEPVTITEDCYEEDHHYVMGHGQVYTGFDPYSQPPQFPASFY